MRSRTSQAPQRDAPGRVAASEFLHEVLPLELELAASSNQPNGRLRPADLPGVEDVAAAK
jgi:hypothetical protein